MVNEIEPFLDINDVSRITGRSIAALRLDAMYRQGIPFYKIGRLVRYRKSEVEAWLSAQRVVTQPIASAEVA